MNIQQHALLAFGQTFLERTTGTAFANVNRLLP